MAKRKSTKYVRIFLAAIVAGLLLLGFYHQNNPINTLFRSIGLVEAPVSNTSESRIIVIDVGQGNSIFIQSGSRTVLIDAGEAEYGGKVVSILQKAGVSKLDLVIATHPHSDHIGGLKAVLEKIPTDKILMPQIPEAIVPTTAVYTNLLKTIAEKKISVEIPKAGQGYELDSGVLEIVGPLKQYDDLNNNSIVARLVYGENSFLFCGDAEKQAEYDMVGSGAVLSSNVMVLGHHGSNTSSTARFLSAVNPQNAIISVGKDNPYNLPSTQVIKSLFAKIYRTDLNGSITIDMNEKTYSITSEGVN